VPREDLPDEHLAANCRLAVAAIVLHEFGHARVSEAAGKSFGFQPTRAMIAQALQADTSPEENHELHGPPWLRAYLHLSARAAARCWPGRYWLDVALNEIEHRYRLQRPAGIFDVLEDEIESFAADRLVDILRRPAPIELASTYQARAAGRTLKG